MRFKIIVIVLALFVFKLSFSQGIEGKITYLASLDNSKLIEKIHKDTKLQENIKKELLSDALNAKDVQFFLLFNKDESLFYSDSEHNMENEGEKKSNLTTIFSGARTIYYHNLKTKKMLSQNSGFDELLIDLEPEVWKLTLETKEIGLYNCYKATTLQKVEGRNGIMYRSITAWYTPQISVPFGVQNFRGLPGLTLELSIDGKTFFKVIKIELSPKEKIVINNPKGKIISSVEFNNKLKEMTLLRN